MTRLVFALAASALLFAQNPAAEAPKASRPGAMYHAPSEATPAARIIAEIKAHGEAAANLERICDDIGPRLTGSDRLLKAHDWTEAKLRSYGLAKVTREAYKFGPAWTRGTESARLLTHSGYRLDVAQMAWTPATKGAVRGEALLLSAKTQEDLLGFLGKFKGKVVVFGDFPDGKADPKAAREAYMKVMKGLQEEGALAIFWESEKKDGLLNMTGSPVPNPYMPPMKSPVAFVAQESMRMLRRLLTKGEKVELEVNLGGVTGPEPVQAYNTLAEIPGTEKPEEIVLLGAHMDSWDLGTGATDNGTGVAAVMEAARAIRAAGLQPKRTIRVALFTGEEQGILGSKAYVKAHEAELPNHQAVLIHDLGTGKLKGWAMQNREDLRGVMAQAIAPLQELDVKELPLEGSYDSDHAPFVKRGIPAFFGVQDQADYFSATHHSQVDTFDHVKPEDLAQGATVLAVTAWELANMDLRLPHKDMAKPAEGGH